MWANAVLAAAFTILILTGLQIMPAWRTPYPECAMRQALLVLAAAAGWAFGLIPVGVALNRHSASWMQWMLMIAAYVSLAALAVWTIAMGTARNAPATWKAAAIGTGFAFPFLYAAVIHRLLHQASR